MAKKSQNLTLLIEGIKRDYFSVWEIWVRIRDTSYKYILTSAYAVGQIEKAISQEKYGKALRYLNQFNRKDIFDEEIKMRDGIYSRGNSPIVVLPNAEVLKGEKL